MKIFMFIYSAIGIIILAILIVYIKHSVYFIFKMQEFFHNFLIIDKSSSNFSDAFYNYLTSSIMKIFHANVSFFVLCEQNKCKLRYYSFSNGELKKLRGFLNLTALHLSNENNYDIIRNRKDIRDKILDHIFFKSNKAKLKKIKRSFIYPIVQNRRVIAFFILLYERIYPYLRGKRAELINGKKMNKVILDMISVLKSRRESIISTMIESIRDYAFVTVDENMNITTWNKGAQIMFGYDSNQIISKSFYKLMQKESFSEFERAVKIAEVKHENKIKIRMVDFNNTVIICEVLIKLAKLEDTIHGFYILIKDISKDEIIKENMRRRSMINRSIVENARDGIILLDNEDRVIYYNEKLKNIVDANSTFLGMHIAQIFAKPYYDEIKQKINEIRKTSIDLNFTELKIGQLWYNIRLFPIKEQGKYQGVIIFFIDNTSLMRTRKELEEKKEMLEKMNKNLLDYLNAAREMQKSLVPKVLPHNRNIHFESIFIMSEELGGDFFYVEELKLERQPYYMVLLTDVSGHGVAASMLSVLVKDVYNDYKKTLRKPEDVKPGNLLNILNTKIASLNIANNKFVTSFFAIVDIKNMKIHYSSAGHPNMVMISQNEYVNFYGIKNSPPLGVREKIHYCDESLKLSKNDKLIFYTDGLLDLFSNENSYLAYFNDFIIQNKSLEISELKKKVEIKINEMLKDNEYEKDDITLILTKIF